MNKKGNAWQVGLFFIIVLIIFSLITFFGYKAFDDIKSEIYNELELEESKDVLDETHGRYPATFDGVVLVMFTLLWLGGIGSAMLKEEHPLLFGITLFIIIFVLITGMFLGNAFEEIFSEDDLIDLTTTFPATFWLITHILQVGIGMILSILLVVMAKNKA